MTHTLHREGSVASLEGDYVVLAMSAKKINDAGSSEKMSRLLEILGKHQHVNLGDMKTGNIYVATRESIIQQVRNNSIVHLVFTDQQVLRQVVRELRKADLGLSIVVTGVFADVHRLVREAGATPHTIEYSAGICGCTEKLAEDGVREVTTMCGHGLVAAQLVRHVSKRIAASKMTPYEASLTLAKPCICGIFNVSRATRLLMGHSRPKHPAMWL